MCIYLNWYLSLTNIAFCPLLTPILTMFLLLFEAWQRGTWKGEGKKVKLPPPHPPSKSFVAWGMFFCSHVLCPYLIQLYFGIHAELNLARCQLIDPIFPPYITLYCLVALSLEYLYLICSLIIIIIFTVFNFH